MNWLDIIADYFRKDETSAIKPVLKVPPPKIEPVVTHPRTKTGRARTEQRRRLSRNENVSRSARSHR